MLGTSKRREQPARRASAPHYVLRKPTATDGPAVSELIAACPPLDRNSPYCNLLQCTDFADTCVLAVMDDKPIGWVSAYRPPGDPDTLFVWQVAVHEDARGLSLGKEMILDILRRDVCAGVRRLKTTVTPDNDASRGMFQSVARALETSLKEMPHFDSSRHFRKRQDSEHLITIGSFAFG